MMKNITIGSKYYVSGRYVKVVKISDQYIQVVWGYNGQSPKRIADRFLSVGLLPYFVEVK